MVKRQSSRSDIARFAINRFWVVSTTWAVSVEQASLDSFPQVFRRINDAEVEPLSICTIYPLIYYELHSGL